MLFIICIFLGLPGACPSSSWAVSAASAPLRERRWSGRLEADWTSESVRRSFDAGSDQRDRGAHGRGGLAGWYDSRLFKKKTFFPHFWIIRNFWEATFLFVGGSRELFCNFWNLNFFHDLSKILIQFSLIYSFHPSSRRESKPALFYCQRPIAWDETNSA